MVEWAASNLGAGDEIVPVGDSDEIPPTHDLSDQAEGPPLGLVRDEDWIVASAPERAPAALGFRPGMVVVLYEGNTLAELTPADLNEEDSPLANRLMSAVRPFLPEVNLDDVAAALGVSGTELREALALVREPDVDPSETGT